MREKLHTASHLLVGAAMLVSFLLVQELDRSLRLVREDLRQLRHEHVELRFRVDQLERDRLRLQESVGALNTARDPRPWDR